MGLPPWLRQTVKTLFAVRCKNLDRQDHFIAFWAWPVKRSWALLESNPARNSRLVTHRSDELGSWSDPAPLVSGRFLIPSIDFPMP